MDQVIWSEKEVVAYYKIISFNLTAGALHADSIKHWVVSYKIEMIFIMIVVTITGIFMATNYLLIYTLGFLYISNSGSADAQLPGCFCPWTFSLNIGLNMFLLDSFMSCLHTLLGYSTGEFQALQLIVLVAFGAVDYPLAPCMLVHILEI